MCKSGIVSKGKQNRDSVRSFRSRSGTAGIVGFCLVLQQTLACLIISELAMPLLALPSVSEHTTPRSLCYHRSFHSRVPSPYTIAPYQSVSISPFHHSFPTTSSLPILTPPSPPERYCTCLTEGTLLSICPKVGTPYPLLCFCTFLLNQHLMRLLTPYVWPQPSHDNSSSLPSALDLTQASKPPSIGPRTLPSQRFPSRNNANHSSLSNMSSKSYFPGVCAVCAQLEWHAPTLH